MLQISIKIITWAVYVVATLSALLVIGLIFKLLVWDTLVVRILKMLKEIKENKKQKEILEKDPFEKEKEEKPPLLLTRAILELKSGKKK